MTRHNTQDHSLIREETLQKHICIYFFFLNIRPDTLRSKVSVIASLAQGLVVFESIILSSQDVSTLITPSNTEVVKKLNVN